MDMNERGSISADLVSYSDESKNRSIQLPNALRVAKIIAIFLLLQILALMLVGILLAIFYGASGADSSDAEIVRRYLDEQLPNFALFGTYASTLLICFWLRKKINDPNDGFSLNFLGIRQCSWRSLIRPACTGAGIAFAYIVIGSVFFPLPADAEVGPLSRMTLTSDWNLFLWCFTGLLFAPLSEEFLFRGVLLAGFLQSWPSKPGSSIAIAATILLFTFLHYGEFVFYPFAALGILTMASAACYFRLSKNSLLAAWAVHFSYNLVLTVPVVIARFA